MTEMTIPAKDGGSFTAYVAMPDKTPAPAIIVIQEIFGINRVMRGTCDALADAGFIAICPDLFWRIEPGIQLDDRKPDELQRAFGLFGQFDVGKGVEDLRATEHVMKGHAQTTGKVGCVGYCLGGKLAYLMATRTNVDCAVGYYGVGIETLLDEAGKIKNPLMLHVAENDKFVDPVAQKKSADALHGNRLVTLHSYADVDHAFTRRGGENFDEKAAALADGRTLDFFRKHLN